VSLAHVLQKYMSIFFAVTRETAWTEDHTRDSLNKLYLNYLHFNDNFISNSSERYKFSYKMIIKYKGKQMENSVQTSALSSDINEGKALRIIWNKKQSKDKKQFQLDTRSDGFDTRLGKLIQNLRLRSNSDKISSDLLREVGINTIDRRRRAEAFWFVTNEDKCRAFIKTSKKGFTSLTALQFAMKKADKSDDTTPQTDVESTKSETDGKSNVGQSNATIKKDMVIDKFALAKALGIVCKNNKIEISELIDLLKHNDIMNKTIEERKAA